MATITPDGPDASAPASVALPSSWRLFVPKSIICLREGYTRADVLREVLAGLTVGVIAIPLAMAFAINSGVPPEYGLYTAIVGGFLISALGGSRVQIGGPTGAFVPILALVVARHGVDGLALATAMAGVILILMGLFRFGGVIKFIPYPVTTGFTTGIAVIIATQQVGYLLGLRLAEQHPDFLSKWSDYAAAIGPDLSGINLLTAGLGVASVAAIALLRRYARRVPAYICVMVVATLLVAVLDLSNPQRWGERALATIGTTFGPIPQSLPAPSLGFLTSISLDRIRDLIPAATTIALLAAIESLLCAVVADGMIGGRHKANLELVSQGVANIASVSMGGIAATGAIARTAANVKSGGRTPLAGMVHAVVVLLAMLLFAPYAVHIPLAVLAAVLLVVAWNMAELDHFRSLMRAPRSDVLVLLTTFGLTVLMDLSVAVGVGVVLAALLLMKRLSEVTGIREITDELNDEADDIATRADPNALATRQVPEDVDVYEINGPFFFGMADRLKDTLRGEGPPPRVFILRMRRVLSIDATALHALDEMHDKCRRQGTTLVLSGVHSQPLTALIRYGLYGNLGPENVTANIDDALDRACVLTGRPAMARPQTAVAEVRPQA